MAISIEEVNYLVWKYLQENGFPHSAFVFETETFANAFLNDNELPPNSLLTLLQRSLLELKLENEILKSQSDPNFQASKQINEIKKKFPPIPQRPPVLQPPLSSQSNEVLNLSINLPPPLYISSVTSTIFRFQSIIRDLKWSSDKKLLILDNNDSIFIYPSLNSSPILISGQFIDGSLAIIVGFDKSIIINSKGEIIHDLQIPLINVYPAPTSFQFLALSPDGSVYFFDKNYNILNHFAPFPDISMITWGDDFSFVLGSSNNLALCLINGQISNLNIQSIKSIHFSKSNLYAFLSDHCIEIWNKNQKIKQYNFPDNIIINCCAWQDSPSNDSILFVGISKEFESSEKFHNFLLKSKDGELIEIFKLTGKPTSIDASPDKIAVGMDSGELLIIGSTESFSFSRSSVSKVSWSGTDLAVLFEEPIVSIISTENYID